MRVGKFKLNVRQLTYAAVCLALALLLPFVTGNIPEIGNMLCPMHLPVLLCGFLCGAPWGMAVGAVAPILRAMLFGRPALYPTALAMMFELAFYGLLAGLLYRLLPKKLGYLYASLLGAMIGGRVAGGLAKLVLLGFDGKSFAVVQGITIISTNVRLKVQLH
jgi:thiamine transporter ThiT